MKQLIVTSAIALAACHSNPEMRDVRTTMSTTTQDQNRTVVRRLFEDGFNRDSTIVGEIVAADYVDAATGARGPTAFQQVMTRLRTAFPDIHYTLDDLVAESDKVAVRWHWTGTHDGVFRGIAPTHKAVTNNGAAIFTVRDGKIVAAALETDRLGFLQSIGVVPSNETLFPVTSGAAPARGDTASGTPARP